MEKKISVIIPCFNSAEYLKKLFSSFENQTFEISQVEYIFVNDASTDNGKTSAVLDEFQK